uniref:Uncharacterized protein n=1 Tax=Trieres chinensis TaxID=1514140 RepID=A0A7S2EL06_TRICV|mmetsp:Transcript_27525/g.56381  ORF Transcript_27525/g.56381 Transcript_27525/m.56381 type:complete len:192 (+) Transcript_27525:156-731(+)
MSGKPAYAVLGIPVINDPNDGFATTLKRGHKCCGGCCDMRRAVIIVNIISVAFGVLTIPFISLGYSVLNASSDFSSAMTDAMDDDEAKQAFADVEKAAGASLGFLIFFTVAKLVCYSCGIYGAMSYNIWLVGISLVAYGLDFIYALTNGSILALLLPGFFAYPHVFFIKEVKEGIMSEENYELEKHSCCCV